MSFSTLRSHQTSEENRFSCSEGSKPTTDNHNDGTEDVNPKHDHDHDHEQDSLPLTSGIFSPAQLRERVKQRRALLAQKRVEDKVEDEQEKTEEEDSPIAPLESNSNNSDPQPQPEDKDEADPHPRHTTEPETPSSPEHHPSSSPSSPTKRNESQNDMIANEEDGRHTLSAYGECVSPEDGFAVSASTSEFDVILDNTPPLNGGFGLGGRIQRPPVPSRKYYGLGSPSARMLRKHLRSRPQENRMISAAEDYEALLESFRTLRRSSSSVRSSRSSPGSGSLSMCASPNGSPISDRSTSQRSRMVGTPDTTPNSTKRFVTPVSSPRSSLGTGSVPGSGSSSGVGSVRRRSGTMDYYDVDNSPTKSVGRQTSQISISGAQGSPSPLRGSVKRKSSESSMGMDSPGSVGGKRKRKGGDVVYNDAPEMVDFGPLQHLPKVPRRMSLPRWDDIKE